MNRGISPGSRVGRPGTAVLSFALICGIVMFSGYASAREALKAGEGLNDAGRGEEFVPGEVLVWFDDAVTRAEAESAVERVGAKVLRRSEITPSRMVVSVPAGDEDAYAASLGRIGGVRVAEKNYIYYALFAPNDTYYRYQWHYNKANFIRAEEGWDVERGAGNVVVAVIDTGVAYENFGVPSYERGDVRGSSYFQAPDLAGTNFVAGYDFVNNDTHPNDQNGHGTHVAGTIAQTTNNGANVAGLAHNCSLMPIQVLDYSGSGSTDDVADGIDFARENSAHVINMSLGASSPSETLRLVCNDAEAAGLVIVAASGNSGVSSVFYPAAYDSVIAVGAVDYNGDLAYYSNYGLDQEIVAPGGDLTADVNGDGYADGVLQMTYEDMGTASEGANVTTFTNYFLQGTSMASPHVAALAALLISHGVTSNEKVRALLRDTATDLGSPGFDEQYGHGLINCEAALTGQIPESNTECGDCAQLSLAEYAFFLGLFFGAYGIIFTRRKFLQK